MSKPPKIAVLGAGLAGCVSALQLARKGYRVSLIDKNAYPMAGASLHNEGKLHFGYVYASQSRDTHQLVTRGSLSFFDVLEDLIGVGREEFAVSKPFVYVVPDDSLLSPREVLAHFEVVDANLAAVGATEKSNELSEEFVRLNYSGHVELAIQTPEIAVDAHQVAEVVGAAVLAHPSICWLGGQKVVSGVSRKVTFGVQTEANGEGQPKEHLFDGVINALWEGRFHLDRAVGLARADDWMWRWKATISVSGEMAPAIPPTTAVLGPYGDVVEYGRQRSYLSWYPVCNQGLTNDAGPDPLAEKVAKLDRRTVLRESIEGLSQLVPAVARIPDLESRARVGGGYIMAIGSSDIDDAGSRLHDRDRVGVEQYDGWVSVETGKYCTAPLFGVEAATKLARHLEGRE